MLGSRHGACRGLGGGEVAEGMSQGRRRCLPCPLQPTGDRQAPLMEKGGPDVLREGQQFVLQLMEHLLQ